MRTARLPYGFVEPCRPSKAHKKISRPVWSEAVFRSQQQPFWGPVVRLGRRSWYFPAQPNVRGTQAPARSAPEKLVRNWLGRV